MSSKKVLLAYFSGGITKDQTVKILKDKNDVKLKSKQKEAK